MAITRKQHYRGSDFNDKDLKDAKSLQLNQDAVSSDEAVRKSQAESISDQAAQDILVSLSTSASGQTAFTSSSMVGFLGNKQDNLEIDASSAAYLQIVDGYKIKATQLLITDVEVNETYSDLAAYLLGESPAKQQGDVIILTAATDNQERSWIKTGSANQDVSGYTRLQTDYNIVSIRAMFSVATYLSYDAASGQFGLVLGNTVGDLGAHTLPIDGSLFTSITGSTIGEIAKKLEDFIIQVDTNATGGSTTIDTRLSTLSGVSSNSMELFTTLFSNNSTIKGLFIESEAFHQAAIVDRALIRNQFSDADTGLQSSIDSEVTARIASVNQEASTRIANDNTINARIDATDLSLSNEETRAISAESALDSRLDIVEGGAHVSGSVSKAQADAQAFASNAVSNEAVSRQAADAVLQSQINAISDAFQYKGNVASDGRIVHQDTTDANHQKMLENASFEAGDMYKMNVAKTFTFTDFTTIEVEIGDSLVALTPCPAGTCGAADFHKWDNTEAADIIREGMLDDVTIEKVGGTVKVVDDSIGRTQLAADVEADIDDKRSLTSDNAITSNADTHIVTDTTTGAAQNMYYKRTSNTSDALTGTKRTQLAELYVGSNGSANPLAPNFAHTGTWSTHYTGTSTDMSMAVGGGNFEANVVNPNSAVFATGVYALAQSAQLGINSAVTGVAQNAGISNIGITGFGKAGGIGKDRGGVFALSDLEFLSYAGYRAVTPISYPDVALLADAGTSSTGKALVAIGDSIFEGGSVTVPGAVAVTDAVNLGDIKATEFSVTVTIAANSNEVINHGLGTKKIMPTVWVGDELSTSAFDIERSTNSMTIYNDTVSAVTCEILIKSFI